MSTHTEISGQETADRLAIRELIDEYAHCADRRLAAQQAGLYAENGTTLVYMADPATAEPVQTLSGRSEHEDAFRAGLSQYAATMHFNGQSTVVLDGANATNRSYCLAHHLTDGEDRRSLLVMAIRYEDQLVKQDGRWLFSERRLIIDWSDNRPSQP